MADLPEFVRLVFRASWDEFYQWKVEENTKSMQSLMQPGRLGGACWGQFYPWEVDENTKAMKSLTPPAGPETILPEIDHVEEDAGAEGIGPSFTVTEYSSDSEECEQYMLSCETVNVPPITLDPPFTTFQQTTRSVMGSNDLENMPFIAFSDDPSFPYEKQIRHYKNFAWQNPDDPDRELGLKKTYIGTHRLQWKLSGFKPSRNLYNITE